MSDKTTFKLQNDIQKVIDDLESAKSVNKMTKKEVKELAQEEVLSQVSSIGYRIYESGNYTQEEAEILMIAIKKQMDRVAKMFGYEEAYFS